MYQALYRKYRSQTFNQMVGQEVAARTLRQAVASHKISHAYLFSGFGGTGKTSAAKIFAKAMNCPSQRDGEPCNDCHICQSITQGNLEDVIEIDAASNNGVDEIRDIRDKSTYAPSLARYKVYIIDEVHMLSAGAFNALLKTLEEPTENVVFILATTELHKIPATILSRVQRFEFKAIKTKAIQAHLAFVLDQEGISYDDSALTMIAQRAEGGMRDALSILDQAISLSDDNTLSLETAEEITGSISLKALDTYVAAVLSHDANQALGQIQIIFEEGKSMSRFAIDLLAYLRDLIVVKAGGQEVQRSQTFTDNLQADQDQIFELIHQATQGLQAIKASAQPKIYAELMTVRLAELRGAGREEASSQLLVQLESLERQVKSLESQLADLKKGGGAVQKPARSNVATNPVKRAYQADRNRVNQILQEAVEQPVQARENLTKLQNAWEEIITSLSGPDRALLSGSQPVAANESHAILAFESSFNAEQTMKRENLNLMFGNILSQAAGFSPEILAIAQEEWLQIRSDFSKKAREQKLSVVEERPAEPSPEPSDIPEELRFLADKISIRED